jgi:hypothetical protein
VLFSVRGSALGRTGRPAIDNDLSPEEELELVSRVRSWIAIGLVGCASSIQSLPDRVASGAVRSPMELVGETKGVDSELKAPMTRGRVWIAPGGSSVVFELVSDGRPIGVVAELDPAGNVTAMRVYADTTHTHPRSPMPSEGTAIATGHGTPA